LQIPQEAVQGLDLRAAITPTVEEQALRFESEKHLMDSTVVSFTQTMFGLPIYQAGVSVTLQSPDNSVRAASSTLHYDIAAQPPGDTLTGATMNAAAVGGYDDLVRSALPAASEMRINRTRLMVYRYDAATRTYTHAPGDSESGFHTEPPTLPLPPLASSIVDGKHYVAVEALFALPVEGYPTLNWRAFIEPETRSVLYLRALTDGAMGLVFDRDPMTKTANAANLPSANSATLNLLRDTITLVDLGPVMAGQQNLAGSFVFLTDKTPRRPSCRPNPRRSISTTCRAPTTSRPSMPTIIATASSAWCGTWASRSRPTSTAPHSLYRSITAAWGMQSMRNARATTWETVSASCSSPSPMPAMSPTRSASRRIGAWCCTSLPATASSGTT
jgi:hypothetical protein